MLQVNDEVFYKPKNLKAVIDFIEDGYVEIKFPSGSTFSCSLDDLSHADEIVVSVRPKDEILNGRIAYLQQKQPERYVAGQVFYKNAVRNGIAWNALKPSMKLDYIGVSEGLKKTLSCYSDDEWARFVTPKVDN